MTRAHFIRNSCLKPIAPSRRPAAKGHYLAENFSFFDFARGTKKFFKTRKKIFLLCPARQRGAE
jgi:hypothetical protein